MYITTNNGILNLDTVILVKMDHLTMAKDDRYTLEAITTSIYERYRQKEHQREHRIQKPAEVLPYSVLITHGTLKDCQNQFDKIAEQDNFIQFTKKEHQNEYPRLLNLRHIININESPNGQDGSLEIIVNTFGNDTAAFKNDYSTCHFPSLSPYKLSFYDRQGHNCKEIIEAIKENVSIL